MALQRRTLDLQRESETQLRGALGLDGRLQGILNAVVPQSDGIGYIRELNRLWEQVRDKFLAMGEYLELAKATLPHGHYEMMFADANHGPASPHGGLRLSFNSATGSKLRAIYRATRDGRIPREQLPNAWGTAYELAKLNDSEFSVAQARGLIRQDVFRSEILSLVRELRSLGGSTKRQMLVRERQQLMRELRRINNRLVEINLEIRGEEKDGDTIKGEIEGNSGRVS